MHRAYIKQEMERLRLELDKQIDEGRRGGICTDAKLYEMSTDMDNLINRYIREEQKVGCK